jgi:hypothetical protein
MKYYPLNRVKTNQKTSGNELLLGGVSYRGSYYQTYDGKYFTGPNPIQGPSVELTPVIEETVQDLKSLRSTTNLPDNNDSLVQEYGSLIASRPTQNINYQTPQSYYPKPTDDDYARRSFTRYFAKKRGQAGFVIEIDQTTFDALKAADDTYDYINYECISTLWQLVGPLRDDRTNRQYKIAGIIDTNERLINAKEPTFVGLKAFIGGEYAKFAKPTK